MEVQIREHRMRQDLENHICNALPDLRISIRT
jgi:hypothetical protein